MHIGISRRELFKAVSGASGFFLTQSALAQQTESPSIPNTQSEAKGLSTFLDSYVSYLRVRDDLKKNPNASPSATAQLDENATGVINAIPSAKRDFKSVIAKAKASAVWSRADAVFEQNVEKSDLNLKQKTQLVLLVKRRGGVKAVLENTLRELDHLATEIGQEVAIIRRKHSEFLHFELINPSYAALSHNQCLVLLGVATAHFVLGFYHVAGVLVAAGIFECV